MNPLASVTYIVEFLTAIPLGAVKRALEPTASTEPAAPRISPAIVYVTLATIMRIQLLPVSATKRTSFESIVMPAGEFKREFSVSPSTHPGMPGLPAIVDTVHTPFARVSLRIV